MKKRGRLKISEYIITIILVITLNFLLPRLMPGDPFLFISAEQGQDVMYTEEQREEYLEYYGLNEPITEQYFSYLSKLAEGDMGYSLYYNEAVQKIIMRRLVWTVFLVISALIISTLMGIILGSISAWYRNSWIDKILFFKLIIFSEIPSFLLGLMFLFVFAAELQWFPLSGSISHFTQFDNIWEKFANIIHHSVLPITTLAAARLGGVYLLSRSSVADVLQKEYIRTAKAKGLSKIKIIKDHVIRNALLPVVTRMFLSLGSLVGGAVLVENVFAYPGLGHLMREAVMVRDYSLIQGIFLVISIFVLTANFTADFIYRKIDPRIENNDDKNPGLSGS